MIYLDDGAIAAILTAAPGSAALQDFLKERASQRWFTLSLTRTALSRDHALTDPQLGGLDSLDAVHVTDRLMAIAAAAPSGISLIDALHIAAAQTAGLRLHTFITADAVRAEGARAAQLPVHELGRKNAQ